MYRIIIFLLIAWATWGCSTPGISTSDLQIPQAVQDAFTIQFPSVNQVKWEKESSDVYEAEFKKNGKKVSSNFDITGAWLETETEIKVADLLQVVQESIAQSFPGFKIEEAETLEQPEQALVFEVSLENKLTNEKIEATFGANGSLLGSEAEVED